MKRLAFLPALLALFVACSARADLQGDAKALSALFDPAKLATLKERGANPRVQKAVAILESSRRDGNKVKTVAGEAERVSQAEPVLVLGAAGFHAVVTTEIAVQSREEVREIVGNLT